jgi:acetyl esterase
VSVPLEPRIQKLVAMANRWPTLAVDAPMAQKRAAAARTARLAWIVMRPGPKMASITHHLVPVDGGSILARVYRPFAGELPLHVFFHGGGWCVGTLDERDSRCQAVAADVGCVVASVDYRMAPENQYPTAPEDCYAALCWLVANAEVLGLDPSAVSVGGESAGANLAAVVSLMARDRHGPPLVAQLLEVPATDLTMSQPSVQALGTGYLLTRDEMDAFVDAYVPDARRRTEPYASPLFAPDLADLPPAWVMTAEFDPLRDEGAAYAARLAEAGVPTEHRRLEGHLHSSFAFTRLLASARAYHDDWVRHLRAVHEARR